MNQLTRKIFTLLFMVFSIFMLVSCGEKEMVDPIEEPIVYAQVEGRVVYYYNSYKGDVADSGAKVVLLKVVQEKVASETAKKIIKAIAYPSIYYEGHEEEFAELGLYMVKVDSNGDYTLNSIPNGRYTLYIHTNHVDFVGNITGAYSITVNDIEYQIPFSQEQSQYYGFDQDPISNWITLSKYSTKQINITGTSYNVGETDFGMCSLGIGVLNPW